MPAEQVNGIEQELPATEADAKQTSMTGAPSTRQLEAFCDELQARTLQQAAQALELFHREPWDLFFVQLDTLDVAQHFLWRYSDPGDPTYPGRNRYAGRVQEFYRLFDEITGRFRRSMPDDAVLMVVSGYGHGRRCVHRLHINEWLRRQGLLVAQERLQDLLPLLPHLARHLPGRRAVRPSLTSIDRSASMAQLVELAGTSSFGGIVLHRDVLAHRGESYRHVRAALLQKLLQLRVKGYPVVRLAKTREELHEGAFTSRYPDIVFELRSDYGVAGDLFVPLVTPDGNHRLISGAHTAQGVLLMEHIPARFAVREGIQEPTVMDVAPTVLQLLGLPDRKHYGTSLLLPRSVTQLI
jgi:predicted AlkP superfamily phosphohydrolase/phosphomutase